MYAKLINEKLEYAPETYTIENGTQILNFNKSIFYLIKYGYKPVKNLCPPIDSNFQKAVFSHYQEQEDCIEIHYNIIDKTTEISNTILSDLLNNILKEERNK